MMPSENIAYRCPATLAEALEIQRDESTRGRLLAGGTDLMAQWAAGVPVPERVTVVRNLPELRRLEVDAAAGRAFVGAAVTHARLRDCAELKTLLPALAAACASVGATQIQALGTIGGNAANASPAGDTGPALLVTGGTAVVASAARGERRVALADFWQGYRKIDLAPDEILVGFDLPGCGVARERFTKTGTRQAQAISKVMCASRIEFADGKLGKVAIAMGSMAATPIRLREVEALLEGKELSAPLVDEAEALAQATVQPIADIRSTAEYRRWMAGRLVRDALEAL